VLKTDESERRNNFTEFSISPDGRYIAARLAGANDDLWTYAIADGTSVRFTSEAPDEISPQWTADGKRIAFGTRVGRMFWKPADGSGEREEIFRGEHAILPGSVSSNGQMLAFVEVHPSRQRDISLMPISGERKAQAFQSTAADEWGPKFSPNGRFIAYVSNESGREEIHIRPTGSAGGRKQISTEGGTHPVWNPNGRELFFLKDDKLSVVPLDDQANPAGPHRVIVDAPRLDDLYFLPPYFYDVMPDGEHFVMVLMPRYPPPTHYNLIFNWFERLKP
jgi:serine/threonine-protein kinase